MNNLPELYPGRLAVLIAPYAAAEILPALAARLAQRGRLRILDAGNRFDAYGLARALRRLSAAPLEESLSRVRLARAFTCYQMLALAAQAPADANPTLVIDLLSTFYDESVALQERRRLLRGCLDELQRLSRQAPVVVTLRPLPPGSQDKSGFMAQVQAAADACWMPEAPAPPPAPLRLF